jgi:hypothetical protein
MVRAHLEGPMNIRRFVKALFFKMIRPLFVKDIDPNEDYNCITCNEPVLYRDLYCSQECYDYFNQ